MSKACILGWHCNTSTWARDVNDNTFHSFYIEQSISTKHFVLKYIKAVIDSQTTELIRGFI